MTSFKAQACNSIQGTLSPPGDKSISHRAVMLSALARGRSEFTNFLEADDCLRTMDAFRKMGVSIESEKRKVIVDGVGLQGLLAPQGELYLGNSGTTMRLLLGILATQTFEAKLTGDPSLSKRPMRRVTAPLRKMGAKISGRDDANFAPLTIQGARLNAIHHVNVPASAQVKSAILLAGLAAKGETIVEEPILSRDHTERMLQAVGAPIARHGKATQIQSSDQLRPLQLRIPGDISSAAFFIVAACILPGSRLTIEHVGLNPTRIGILEALKSMGAQIEWRIQSEHAEPVGEITVKSSKLRALEISSKMIPSLIDELPILMIACAFAEGESTIRGAHELRVKETDRIQSMVQGLNAVGGDARELDDGCVIQGMKELKGGRVASFGDHRTAMSFIVAGLKSRSDIQVEDIDCIATSYPGFLEDLKSLSK